MNESERLRVLSQRTPPVTETDEAIITLAAVITVVAALVFAVSLLAELSLVVYGGALAVGLIALAVGVRRYFAAGFPDIEAIEERTPVDGGDDARLPLTDVARVGRRPLLGRVLAAATGVFAVSLLAFFPSLGPAPGMALQRTAWRRGLRLVTSDNRPLRPQDIVSGGVSTMWPEGHIGDEYSSVIVVRLTDTMPRPPTRLEWVVGGKLVAYSKICTHAGCPVGLFRERDHSLFCPCHQSTFDAARGAVPTFGPTARALPQLPLGVDDDGFLVALGDFEAQVGPAFG